MADRETEELVTISPSPDDPEPGGDRSGRRFRRTSAAAYATMLGLLFIGVLTAIGHHSFYSYLDNRRIEDSVPQTWAIRIGNAFAYLFKMVLVAAVAVAYAQGFWFFVRRKSLEIGSLDNCFAVLSNPLLFFNRDLVEHTTLLFAVAIVSWLLPLAAVFAPGTLTVTAVGQSEVANVNIPILASLNDNVGLLQNVGESQLIRVISRVTSGGELISWPSPCGVNCTYTFTFVGPAYQCVDLSSNPPDNITQLLAATPQQDPPPFLNSSIWYDGINDWGGGTSPIAVWMFYNSFNNTMKCTLYNATYTTNVSYVNNIQYVQSTVEPLHTIALMSQSQFDGLDDPNSPPIPNNQALNLWQIHQTMGEILFGWIGVGEMDGLENSMQVNAGISMWAGVANWSSNNFTLPDDLPSKVQDLMANFTISLIDIRNDPYPPSRMKDLNISSQVVTQTSVPATITSYPAVYTYSHEALWQIYATALGVTVICVLFGSMMLYTNGIAGQLSFSQVLVTTRNPTLDKISQGAGRGGKYITDQVRRVRVRYGRLESDFGFGTEDEVHSVNEGL